MTLLEAQTQRDELNDNGNLPASLEAVVGEQINFRYESDYSVFIMTASRVSAYNAADIVGKQPYGQAAYYAASNVAALNSSYETLYEDKIIELLE